MRRPAPIVILAAGGLAGVLDITATCTLWGFRGVAPVRIFHAIASGLLGRDAAVAGGWKTAALGLALHFFIATSAAAVFYAASRLLPFLISQPLIWGPVYGVVVYLVMNHIVIPLSAMKPSPPVPIMVAAQIVIHMVCVGTPIVLIVRRFGGGSH